MPCHYCSTQPWAMPEDRQALMFGATAFLREPPRPLMICGCGTLFFPPAAAVAREPESASERQERHLALIDRSLESAGLGGQPGMSARELLKEALRVTERPAPPREVPRSVWDLKERLSHWRSCVASLDRDTSWLATRNLLELVVASDVTEVARLAEAAWKSLGELEELARLLKEALHGKEPES